jgi:hypothetical protein
MGAAIMPATEPMSPASLVSDHAAYIHGECVTIDGGRWLKGAGTFSHLETLSDEQWAAMRQRGREGRRD